MGIGIVATILLIGNRCADDGYQALIEHRRAGTKLDSLTMTRGLPRAVDRLSRVPVALVILR